MKNKLLFIKRDKMFDTGEVGGSDIRLGVEREGSFVAKEGRKKP